MTIEICSTNQNQKHITPTKAKKKKNKEKYIFKLNKVSHSQSPTVYDADNIPFFFFSQKNTSGFPWSHKLRTFVPGFELFTIQLPTLTWHQTKQKQRESWWTEMRVRAMKAGKEWLVSTKTWGVNVGGGGKWSPHHLSGFCVGASTAIQLTPNTVWQQIRPIATRPRS